MVSYDPWGRVLSETGTPRLALGFHAGITDRDTGLVHISRRDCDPERGRFTTPTRDVAPLKRVGPHSCRCRCVGGTRRRMLTKLDR